VLWAIVFGVARVIAELDADCALEHGVYPWNDNCNIVEGSISHTCDQCSLSKVFYFLARRPVR